MYEVWDCSTSRSHTGAHVRMFRFFDGAPELPVSDNLRSGVNKASSYPPMTREYASPVTIKAEISGCDPRSA